MKQQLFLSFLLIGFFVSPTFQQFAREESFISLMDNIDELWKQSKDNHTELSNQLKDLKEQIITNNT